MRLFAVTYAAAAAVMLYTRCRGAEQCGSLVASLKRSAQTPGQTDVWHRASKLAAGDAPVGDRRPRAKTYPPGVEQKSGNRSPEEQAIDRKLRIVAIAELLVRDHVERHLRRCARSQ